MGFSRAGYFLEFPSPASNTPARDETSAGMKTLHAYLTRQVLATLVMTVAVFTFVLMLGSVLKEILGLLVNRQADLGLVAQAIGLLIPFVLVFALPMGMLTAALLVFGRFSADNELTAVRASGVSLVSLVTPVLLLSVALSGVAALINLQLAPQCRIAYKRLLQQVGAAQAGSFIPEKTYIKEFNTNVIVYISKVRGTNLEDVLVYKLREDKVESYSRAEQGVVWFNPSNRVFTVVLSNAHQVFFHEGQRLPQPFLAGTAEFSFTNAPPRAERRKADLSDMTFFQLREELRELDKRLESSAAVKPSSGEELREQMRLMRTQRKLDLTLPARVQMHRQVAFSFACVGFTLIGIPLGIRAHRRETTFGIAVALVLVVLYYSFFILGESLATRPDLAPHLILWAPNFLFQAVGMVLLWRANRGV
jgi:lipopolysaccharide export system permease protein